MGRIYWILLFTYLNDAGVNMSKLEKFRLILDVVLILFFAYFIISAIFTSKDFLSENSQLKQANNKLTNDLYQSCSEKNQLISLTNQLGNYSNECLKEMGKQINYSEEINQFPKINLSKC